MFKKVFIVPELDQDSIRYRCFHFQKVILLVFVSNCSFSNLKFSLYLVPLRSYLYSLSNSLHFTIEAISKENLPSSDIDLYIDFVELVIAQNIFFGKSFDYVEVLDTGLFYNFEPSRVQLFVNVVIVVCCFFNDIRIHFLINLSFKASYRKGLRYKTNISSRIYYNSDSFSIYARVGFKQSII